jgi:colicin import membrane protein
LSTVSQSRAPKPRPTAPELDPDPFRFGWRYVRKAQPVGKELFDQVPLTLEDVLHPEVGDFIVHTDGHGSDCMYLKMTSKRRLKDDPTAVVLSDCRVDWNIPGVRPLGPDLAVFFGARRHIDWSTFHVAKEKARPALVIEVTSPDTRNNDVVIKVDYYHRAGVPLYVIADVTEEKDKERRIELIGYEAGPRRYKRVKPDKRGWIWLPPLRLWLGLSIDRQGGYTRLACFDPDTGQEVGDLTAVSDDLDRSEQLRQEAEARAKAESVRAEAESLRAEAEAQARAIAEERIRALEAELNRARGRKV